MPFGLGLQQLGVLKNTLLSVQTLDFFHENTLRHGVSLPHLPDTIKFWGRGGGGGGVVKIGVGRENSYGYFGGLGWSVISGYK